MLQQHRNWYRNLAAALAVSAIAPATAAAVPAIDGQGGTVGGDPGLTPESVSAPHKPSAAATSNDGGDPGTDAWIAIGGAALVAAGGIGIAGRKRVQAAKP